MSALSKIGWVYVLDTGLDIDPSSEVRIYKIGRATKLDRRVKQLKIAFPRIVSVAYAFYHCDHVAAEKELHEKFASKRMNGEWFKLDYSDLGAIAEYANYRGQMETRCGNYIPDPFGIQIYNEEAAIAAATAELEASPAFACSVKYWPLNKSADIPADLFEVEEFYADWTDHDAEEQARRHEEEEWDEYERMCREEDERQRRRHQAEEESEDADSEEEEDWDHEYLEEGDSDLVQFIEDVMTGRVAVAEYGNHYNF